MNCSVEVCIEADAAVVALMPTCFSLQLICRLQLMGEPAVVVQVTVVVAVGNIRFMFVAQLFTSQAASTDGLQVLPAAQPGDGSVLRTPEASVTTPPAIVKVAAATPADQ